MSVIGHGVEIVPSALQRPSSPPDGSLIYQSDINQLLVWNGSVWGPLGAGSITTDSVAPSSPSSGDLWYDTNSGKTFVYYDDGSSAQWVEIGASSTLPNHASSHVRGGADVLDGDRLNIDYTPSYYTRDSAASGAGDVTDLTAHLGGINNKFEKVRVDSSGRVTLPYQPIFKAHSTNNTISNGALWPLPVTSVNVGNHFNTSTYLFTAPVSGYYFFGGMIRVDSNQGYVHLQSYLNGAINNQNNALPGLGTTGSSLNFTSESFSYLRFLNQGNTFGFLVNWNSGGPYNIHTQSHLFGFLLF